VGSDSDFYIGFAQTASESVYFPMGSQAEYPNRNNAFYTAFIDGSNLHESDPCRVYESGETEEYNLVVLPGVPMTYLSGPAVQCDTLPPVLHGSFDNKIIG
jgi:hypothetical protein